MPMPAAILVIYRGAGCQGEVRIGSGNHHAASFVLVVERLARRHPRSGLPGFSSTLRTQEGSLMLPLLD